MMATRMAKRFDLLQKSNEEKYKKIKLLEEQVEALELKIDQQEQYSRRSSVRISGIKCSLNICNSKKFSVHFIRA